MYRRKYSSGHIRPGLTLIELLAVISVIAILASILVIAVGNISEKRDSVKCITNLRQLGAASIVYAADNDGKFPLLRGYYSDSGAMEFWYRELRPYLGATTKSLFSASYPLGKNLDVFYCPSVEYDKAYPHTHYGANPYVFLWPPSADQFLQNAVAAIPEPSRTVMFSETKNPSQPDWDEGTWQTSPAEAKANPDVQLPSNRHGGYVNMVFVDGHTESIEFSKLKEDTERYFGKAPFN